MPTNSARRSVYRGAIIGAGGIARNAHIPAFRQGGGVRERVEIVALVDAAPDVAPVAGLAAPVLRSPSELERLGPLDFIDICTPTASHLDLALWGLERGYHVICEKPVAVTRAEADRLAAAARAAGRVVMPCHQYRFNPAWLKVREWLSDHRIGRWYLADFTVHRQSADPGSRPGERPWRGTGGASRGGVLLDHGTHLIYQLLDVAGEPAGVRAWVARLLHQEYDVEDTAGVLLEYPDRLATCFMTWASHHRETRLRFVGEEGRIEWSGGELLLERHGAGGRTERLDFSRELDKASYWRWFACLFQDFVAALDGRDASPFLDDVARVAGVLERAYESARPAAAELPVAAPE
ncbi:MAG TPA: Gfo/Idh/MocA family oxidoreductase [Gemmatimonadales bacterium]|nr:Gfo/Idh/MocA family oxidoreductase [Gemmatimonadales bacterium]